MRAAHAQPLRTHGAPLLLRSIHTPHRPAHARPPPSPPPPQQVCGLRRGEFIHVLGDAHVYANHVGPLSQQLSNAPRHLPSLAINPGVSDIDGFAASDFTLAGYAPHKTIRMQMAV